MSKGMKKRIAMVLVLALVAVPLMGLIRPEAEAPDRSDAIEKAVSEWSEQSEAESMEIALIAAKELLDIDDAVYTEFSYSSSFSNYETREGLMWHFSWSDEGYNYIYALVMEDGTLMQYGKYMYSFDRYGFAEISKSRALEIADEFLKRAKADTYDYYKVSDDINISIHNKDYRISYFAESDGYAFSVANVTISIDKYTGEVSGYSSSNADPSRFIFEDPSVIISESEAVEAYAEKIGLRLEYASYYDYEEGTIKIFPIYLFNSHGDRFIGATSGEIVDYVYDRGLLVGYNDMVMTDEADGMFESASGRASLTPAELSAIEDVSNYITRDEALEKLLEAMELTNVNVNSFDERFISLNRDYYNKDRYYYDINLYSYQYRDDYSSDEVRSIYGRVEALSGRVQSFSIDYMGMPSTDTEFSEEQARAAVDAFLKKIAPDEYGKSKVYEDRYSSGLTYNWRGDYYFDFSRYENDVPFPDNGISVSFNRYTGKVVRFNLNWYENVRFPSVRNVRTPLSALSEFVSQTGSELKYITVGDGFAGLVYEFDYWSYIDPFSGKALDYTGESLVIEDIAPDYSDVAGHWSEAIVRRLLDNGVYLWGGKFEPNKTMTEHEFLQYLLLAESYYQYPEPRDFFTQQGIDINIDADRILTRQEAARIIGDYLGYGKLAEQSEWFVYPFIDEVDEDYKGYITICFMLDIIGGAGGSFNAGANVTRAQAASMLHNIIEYKSS
ncbi:MAG: S-layer homology domain-containing protein [Oscillospiraceae bacterium]|nr:S-layer homology domain-containing protein [Oscillospiraceae bacterium]